jgi:hypothetical protein
VGVHQWVLKVSSRFMRTHVQVSAAGASRRRSANSWGAQVPLCGCCEQKSHRYCQRYRLWQCKSLLNDARHLTATATEWRQIRQVSLSVKLTQKN